MTYGAFRYDQNITALVRYRKIAGEGNRTLVSIEPGSFARRDGVALKGRCV